MIEANAWLLAAAVICSAAAGLLWLRSAPSSAGRSRSRAGMGFAVTLATMAVGSALIGVDVEPAPEQRGIGVAVSGVGRDVLRDRDSGVRLALVVEATDCDGPIRARVTVAPAAEFWIDNARGLSGTATVTVAVPNLSDADVGSAPDLGELRAWLGDDGLNPFTSRQPSRVHDQLAPVARPIRAATLIAVEIDDWARSLGPLTIEFTTDWTHPRSSLGSCYLSLPALTGLPTVLSTAQIYGDAVSLADRPSGDANFFVVASKSANLHAFYQPEYEVTRGLTSLVLRDHALVEGATRPAPNVNVEGAPAWACRSDQVQTVQFPGERPPGSPARDVYVSLDGGTMAFSDDRIGEILRQETCASFVAIESSSAGPRRDFLLAGIGTFLSAGIGLMMSGLRRRPEPR